MAIPNTNEFIAGLEGFSPTPFWDVHQWSIGYGTKATPDEVAGKTAITKEDALQRLESKSAKAQKYVNSIVTVPLSPNQMTALTSLAYNVGSFGSGLINAINTDPASVPTWMAKYGVDDPSLEKGVAARRNKEIDAWNSASETAWPMPNLSPLGGGWAQSAAIRVPQAEYAGPPGWALAGGFDDPIQVAGIPGGWNNYAPEPSATPAAFQAVMEPPETKLSGGNEATKYFTMPAATEASVVPKGPYGADALIKAAMAGDANAMNAAMKNLEGSAKGAGASLLIPAFLGGAGLNIEQATAKIYGEIGAYFEGLLDKAPGAVRIAAEQFAANPALYAGMPEAQAKALQEGFAELGAKPEASQWAKPNLSPGFVPPSKAAEPVQVASVGSTPPPMQESFFGSPAKDGVFANDLATTPSFGYDNGPNGWGSLANAVPSIFKPSQGDFWEASASGNSGLSSSTYGLMVGDQLLAPHDPTHYQTSNPNNPWVQPGTASGYEYIGPQAEEEQSEDWAASVGMGPQFQDDYFEGPSTYAEGSPQTTQQPWNIIEDGVGGLFYGLGLGGPQQASASPEPQYMPTIGQQPQPYNPGIGSEPDWMEGPPAALAQQQPNPWLVGGQGPQTGASPWITGQQGPNSGAWQTGQQGPPSAGNPWLVGGTPYQPPTPPPPSKQAPPQQTAMAPSSPPPPPMPTGPSLGLQGIQSAVPSEYQQVSSYEAGEPGVYGAGAVISQDEFGNQYKTYENGNGETYTVSLGEGPGNSGYLLGEGGVLEQNEENGGGGKAALCSFYQRKGWLPKAVWKADTQFSKGFSVEMRAGYKMWARPLVAWMDRGGTWATIVKWALWPIVRAWANEMAHQWDPQEFPRGSVFGRFVLLTLGAVCSWLGQRRKVLA